MREKLLNEIKPAEDSLRFYFLGSDTGIENHGCKIPVDGVEGGKEQKATLRV